MKEEALDLELHNLDSSPRYDFSRILSPYLHNNGIRHPRTGSSLNPSNLIVYAYFVYKMIMLGLMKFHKNNSKMEPIIFFSFSSTLFCCKHLGDGAGVVEEKITVREHNLICFLAFLGNSF